MTILFISLGLFLFGYCVNMFYISILYHRALTHGAIVLGPKLTSWLGLTGGWFTGLDPKTWACMHRLHHTHSDTILDPHSPVHLGVMGVWRGQYEAYLKIQKGLLSKDPKYCAIVSDIPFDVGFCNRKKLSFLPYAVHIMIALIIGGSLGSLWPSIGYFFGIMSHPVQGWMVNALAHKYGSRNFETDDQSKNNLFVGLFVFGEGFQNNHHKFPHSASFSHKWYELDFGYFLCLVAEKMGVFRIQR